jgi:predicted RNase H-like nuclease (RuvC/YqgF family)
MLYSPEGNPRVEDQTLRRIARRTVRAALDRMDAETDAIVNALIAHIGTRSSCKMSADELLLLVNRHPRLQPERSTINRYMDAFPELKATTLSACQSLNRKTLSRLQTILAPLEHARRFANTKGAYRH